MDRLHSPEIDPESLEEFILFDPAAPLECEYQMHIGSPAGAEGRADWSNTTNAPATLESLRHPISSPVSCIVFALVCPRTT